jgi:hypothetical protein
LNSISPVPEDRKLEKEDEQPASAVSEAGLSNQNALRLTDPSPASGTEAVTVQSTKPAMLPDNSSTTPQTNLIVGVTTSSNITDSTSAQETTAIIETNSNKLRSFVTNQIPSNTVPDFKSPATNTQGAAPSEIAGMANIPLVSNAIPNNLQNLNGQTQSIVQLPNLMVQPQEGPSFNTDLNNFQLYERRLIENVQNQRSNQYANSMNGVQGPPTSSGPLPPPSRYGPQFPDRQPPPPQMMGPSPSAPHPPPPSAYSCLSSPPSPPPPPSAYSGPSTVPFQGPPCLQNPPRLLEQPQNGLGGQQLLQQYGGPPPPASYPPQPFTPNHQVIQSSSIQQFTGPGQPYPNYQPPVT